LIQLPYLGCQVTFASWLVGDGTLVLLPNRTDGINGGPAQGAAPQSIKSDDTPHQKAAQLLLGRKYEFQEDILF
jgi:hypothetical protein